MTARVRWLVRVALVLAVVTGIVFLARSLSPGELATALDSAKAWPLVAAAALNFGCIAARAVVWRILLAPRHGIPLHRMFRYHVAAAAASSIAPARVGEVARVWMLKRREGVSGAETVATVLTEKVLDVIAMVVLMAPLPWLVPGLPGWISDGVAVLAGVALVIFVVAFVAAGRASERSWFGRMLGGMSALREPRRAAAGLAILVVVWLGDLVMVALVLYAVGIEIPFAAGLVVLFTLNVSIAIPSTPAHVGTLQLGALAGLRLFHVADEPALVFGLLYHAIQIIPLVVGGLVFEHRLVLGRESVESDAD